MEMLRCGWVKVNRVWLIGFILAFTDLLQCLGSVCLGSHLIPVLLSYINVHDLVHSRSAFTCTFDEQYVYPFYKSRYVYLIACSLSHR